MHGRALAFRFGFAQEVRLAKANRTARWAVVVGAGLWLERFGQRACDMGIGKMSRFAASPTAAGAGADAAHAETRRSWLPLADRFHRHTRIVSVTKLSSYTRLPQTASIALGDEYRRGIVLAAQ